MVDYLVFVAGLWYFRESPVHLLAYLLVAIVVYLIGIYRYVKSLPKGPLT